MAIAINFAMTTAVKNMERGSLKSIIALSVVESWWKNDIVQNSIVYLLSLIVMVHKEIQKY